jgi:hypothetical protein
MKLAIFTIAYRYLKKNFSSKLVIWQMKLLSKNISNQLLLFLLNGKTNAKLVDIAKMPRHTQIALGDHDLENLTKSVLKKRWMNLPDQALY